MKNEKFSLDWVNKEHAKFQRKGGNLTDLVLGKKEMAEVRSWATTLMPKSKPSKSKTKKMLGEPVVWGVQIHTVEEPESYLKSYDLNDPEQEKQFKKEKLVK